MEYTQKLKLATGLFLYAFAVFAVMQVLAISSGGHAAQEAFEIIADPADYSTRLRAADDILRIILLADLFFIIGFGTAIGTTAWAYAETNRVAAWGAGLGILLVMGLDLAEDITLVLSMDIVAQGSDLSAERILAQAQVSSTKWLMSAVVLVIFTFVLPQETLLERLVVWATRLFLPLGAGLFVTGAFDARAFGGLIILGAIASGLALLALTTGLRARQAASSPASA